MERRLAAILAADVVGYTRLMGADEAGTLAALKAHRQDFVDPTVAAHGGRIVKLMGDGALVEFPSAVDAVVCAAEVQRGMAQRNAEVPEERRIAFRIGINLGEVIVEEEDIYGDGVNIAARLEGLAEPGGICLSAKVHEEVRNKTELAFEDLGPKTMKNVAAPIRVFRVADGDSLASDTAPLDADLTLPAKPSIAVLPFDNMSGDPEQEFFSDGVTEDIITALSGFRSIFVIARNSSFVYKGRAEDIKQIGRDLGVRYVLEGSVRKSGGRVRITAQLIEAETGNHIWAQRYDRVQEDVFELQDELTETIVAAIQPELECAERERARRKPPDNLDAWESYQRGLWHAYRMSAEDAARAEAFFREALARAPRFSSARAGLAYLDFQRVIMHFGDFDRSRREEVLARGVADASEAVHWDNRDAFAQWVLGRLLSLQGTFDEALERLELAVELNPNSALAHHGLGYLFAVTGRSAEAVEMFDKALRLSPKDNYRWGFCTMRAFALQLLGDHEGAVEWARKSIRDKDKMFWPYVQVTVGLAYLGREAEAERALADLLRVKPDFSLATVGEAVLMKHPADLEFMLEGLRKAGLPA